MTQWPETLLVSLVMKTLLRVSDLRNQINALRIAAGLQPSKGLFGTSKQALQVVLNRAQRGEFFRTYSIHYVTQDNQFGSRWGTEAYSESEALAQFRAQANVTSVVLAVNVN